MISQGHAPEADKLLEEIKKLIARLDAGDRELFRGLLELARLWQLEPEHFRLLLLSAGLEPSRASELKEIRGNREVRKEFLKEDSRLSWREALDTARAEKPTATDTAIAKLFRALLRHGQYWTSPGPERGWSMVRVARGRIWFERGAERLEVAMLFLPGGEE
jgi:hypothetical protein